MNKKTTAMATLTVARRKVDELLALKKITVENVQELTGAEREIFQERLTQILADSKGVERDNLLAKIELILPDSTKNDVWEHNHTVIRSAISDFMRQYGVMPTKSAIAEETGLSRQTVTKHFKEYKSHPEFIAEAEQFKFMSHEMLASVFKFARNGNMRAARLYFEMVGAINKPGTNTVVTEQKNYIQINNTILSQENLKQLTAEQLLQIENIVRDRVMELPVVVR
ncbi:hypothetical protein IDJ77_05175 [Mucilaginibacter sp. ZT4R22]|uniref:Uncharacterized protein n=1 Tax=Mucilaginibacter pankratovii TaxID=2772110 RepID=A0ABR7WPI5_9SPHI|nr:hypothetical protein [Mucilaginibacter pankratovii]MBD1363197.1 hypothetical protein [Mucilaginibacter pankratovii]